MANEIWIQMKLAHKNKSLAPTYAMEDGKPGESKP